MRTEADETTTLFHPAALEVFSAEIVSNDNGILRLRSMSTQIRRIHFYGPMLDAAGVEKILHACAQLQSLAVDSGGYMTCFDTNYAVHGTVLRECGSNLEELYLAFADTDFCRAQRGA